MDSGAFSTRNTSGIASVNMAGAMSSTTSAINANSITAESQRFQAYKTSMAKFYLHKSFDIQSDMEFLPAIASEASVSSTPTLSPPQINTPVASPSYQYNRMNEYYGPSKTNGNRPTYGNNGAPDSNTPKSRMAYLAQSPKRAPPSSGAAMPMRRRVISGNQQTQFSNAPQDYNAIDQNYMVQNRINQYSNRNW